MLNYTSHGNGEPVVLLHGMAASKQDWSSLLQDLAQAGFQGYAPDLVGHGDSVKPDEPPHYTARAVYNTFENWLEGLALTGPLRLVGRVKWLIDPGYRGAGLGTMLINHFIDTARANGLKFLNCMLISDLEADAVRVLLELGFRETRFAGYGTDPDGGWAFLRTIRKGGDRTFPVMLLVGGGQLGDLEHRDELFDDFCLTPFHPAELEARLRHLLATDIDLHRAELVEYGELTLNLETYQAAIAGRPLDMTYMEYELLKFLAQNPGKVFTREMLLSRVWGYEYYGGARTVDVHVRRLRAKLGEEHANLIQTVRSVGYRFGQSRWDA